MNSGEKQNLRRNPSAFSWKARGRSFRFAFAGFSVLLGEHNAWLHCCAAVGAIACGFIFSISALEWIAIIMCIGCVMALEAVNTALESVCDYASPDFAPMIKRAKDVAAAAVLIMAIVSVVIAAIIFLPRIV